MSTDTDRYPYGAIKDAIVDWVKAAPADIEFFYGDVADDIGAQRPTVSAALNKMSRSSTALVVRGRRAGWYVRPSVAPSWTGPAPEARQPVQAPPPAQPPAEAGPRSGDLLEVVGKFKSGNLMLRAENGSLWEATAL